MVLGWKITTELINERQSHKIERTRTEDSLLLVKSRMLFTLAGRKDPPMKGSVFRVSTRCFVKPCKQIVGGY